MLISPSPHSASGYILVEALVTCSITLLFAAGMWQLVHAATSLATASYNHTTPHCANPACVETTQGIRCNCGTTSFFIVQ